MKTKHNNPAHRVWRALAACLTAIILIAPAASAQPDLDALQRRFKQRYPDLLRLKQDGKIGEAWNGLVAAVEERFEKETQVADLMKDENADRRLLYEALVGDVRAEVEPDKRHLVTPEYVARRSAARNFRKAEPFEYLMVADGLWIQKREERLYQSITDLKDKGAVGETRDGYVALVDAQAASADAASQIEQENKRRRERYAQLAQTRGVSTEVIAEEHAELQFKAADNDHLIRTKDGRWLPKKDQTW